MSRRANRGRSGGKTEARGWFFKSSLLIAFIWGCVELVIHTGIAEFVKVKIQDWHDRMNVEVNYESAQQMYVLDMFGNLKNTDLVSDVRGVLKKMKDDTCRPEWDNNDRIRFRKHCAGPIATEIANSQQNLPAADCNDRRQSSAKRCRVGDLLNQLRRIDSGGPPDSYFVEVRAKITNNGKEIGTLGQQAFLKKGSDQVLSLQYVPSEQRGHVENKCQDLEALGAKAVSPCFKNDSVPVGDWSVKFGAGTEKTELFLTINDAEGKKHEKHTEISSFSPL